MKVYYEVAPNLEIIANQSHSFYFPPMISMSNLLDVKYNNCAPEITDNHTLLDYTMISDEDCINIQMLFSEKPCNQSNDNNIIKFIKSEGIFPVEDSISINDDKGDVI